MKTKVIILAGGSGERFGLTKQFIPIHGIPLFVYTLKKFEDYECVLTIPTEYTQMVKNTINHFQYTNAAITGGGATRQESVFKALKFIEDEKPDNVLITDANRPCISPAKIKECVKTLAKYPMIATVCKSVNTACLSGGGDYLDEVLDRRYMYDLLMPQGFDYKMLYESHKRTTLKNSTDDTQIVNEVYPQIKTRLIQIPYWEGLKLTNPEDYKIFETLLEVK